MATVEANVLAWATLELGAAAVDVRPLGTGGPWLLTTASGDRRAVLVVGDPGDALRALG